MGALSLFSFLGLIFSFSRRPPSFLTLGWTLTARPVGRSGQRKPKEKREAKREEEEEEEEEEENRVRDPLQVTTPPLPLASCNKTY